jgi:4-azaleucine resistance transporter AzlC
MELGLPIFLGYVPVGMAFGILAKQVGFSTVQAILCSATALAGAGQFIAVSLLGSGAGASATLLATGVVNLRYLLFGTTLSPNLHGVTPVKQAWLAFTLTDETFAINVADLKAGTASVASMAGVGLISWMGWVLGTAVGAIGALWIGDPTRWGVDFAMAAMFSALFVALAENRTQVAVGCGAGLLALGLPSVSRLGLPLDANLSVVIAAMVAATVATAVIRER